MTTTTIHKFVLEPYRGRRSRHTCPGCNKPHELTRYIDTETGEYLAPHVGKCNRLNKCAYHYKPKHYFRDNPQLNDRDNWRESEAHKMTYTPPTPPPPPPVDYLPRELAIKSLTAFDKNNFLRYLVKLFGDDKARQLAERYKLGTSKHWRYAGGYAVVFWQIDRAGNVRQAKVMPYNPETGKRIKEPDGLEIFRKGRYQPQPENQKPGAYFAGKQLLKNRDANLVQCFFGEHLLSAAPSAPVAIVESEKTAVIMAGINPKPIWIATGGAYGARWTDRQVFEALEGRRVVLYPDLGMTNEWEEKAKILNTVCRASVSTLLEDNAPEDDRRAGYDIADYFIKQITRTDAAPELQEAPQAEPTPPPEQQPAPQAEPPTEPEPLAVMAADNPAVFELVELMELEATAFKTKDRYQREAKKNVLTPYQVQQHADRLEAEFSKLELQTEPLQINEMTIPNPQRFVNNSLEKLRLDNINGVHAEGIINRLDRVLSFLCDNQLNQ